MDEKKININQLAAKIRKNYKVNENERLVTTNEIELKDFEEAYSKGYTVNLIFDKVDSEQMTATFSDCEVICPIEEFGRGKRQALVRPSEALITSIDKDKRKIYVSCVAAEKNVITRREQETELIDAAILKEIKRNGSAVYPAQVKAIFSNGEGAILSILGTNVVVCVLAKDWSNAYIASLHGVINVGEWYDVEIVSKLKSKSRIHYYNGTRKNIAPDPWKFNRLEERYKVGDKLIVKCISNSVDCWWGINKNIKDIQLMGDYFGSGFSIVPNKMYECRIKRLNIKKHKLVVVPIRELEDMEVLNKNNCTFRKATKK